MPISSYVVEEGPAQGRGHIQHGNGKGLGHSKHAADAMSDGNYEMGIAGISHVNHSAGSQTSAPVILADGSMMNTEVRAGEITIADMPGDTLLDGALRLQTDNANGRLRVNDGFSSDGIIKLGDLDDLSFNYFIQSSDRTDVIPVIRLIIDADGNLATTADRGELVFEWSYQGFGATAIGSQQTADLAGADWVAWQRSNGMNLDQIANMTRLSDWADADGYTPAGGLHFDENSLVLGWSIALGSGNGTTVAYLDDLQVGGKLYDFEL